MELVKLTIDGQEVQVPAGTTVLEEQNSWESIFPGSVMTRT